MGAAFNVRSRDSIFLTFRKFGCITQKALNKKQQDKCAAEFGRIFTERAVNGPDE
jgi:hypothetical protein